MYNYLIQHATFYMPHTKDKPKKDTKVIGIKKEKMVDPSLLYFFFLSLYVYNKSLL